MTLVQTAEIIEPIGFESRARQKQDHAEGTERHDHVDDYIEHRRTVCIQRRAVIRAGGHARKKPEQDEPHVRNRRVRQHALDVGLSDADDVSHRERQHRHQREHSLPFHRQRQ